MVGQKPGEAQKGAEILQDNIMNGTYGATATAGTLALSLATGDTTAVDQSIDNTAERGDRSCWLAISNFLSDQARKFRGTTPNSRCHAKESHGCIITLVKNGKNIIAIAISSMSWRRCQGLGVSIWVLKLCINHRSGSSH